MPRYTLSHSAQYINCANLQYGDFARNKKIKKSANSGFRS
jgi:hypothetical protein